MEEIPRAVKRGSRESEEGCKILRIINANVEVTLNGTRLEIKTLSADGLIHTIKNIDWGFTRVEAMIETGSSYLLQYVEGPDGESLFVLVSMQHRYHSLAEDRIQLKGMKFF